MAGTLAVVIAAVAPGGVGGYAVLYLAVAASWIGIPIVGAGALAAAGVLASEGQLSIWLVLLVASFAAWTGGYIGYWLGRRMGGLVTDGKGRRRRQRRHAMASAERIYRRWGRLGVFLTPTWVSGALRMPQRTFLVWNALAAILSTMIAVLGAYGIGAAALGQLSARRGMLALAVAAMALVAVAVVLYRLRVRAGRIHRSPRATWESNRSCDRSKLRR
jgi:membrane-associated protein